MAYLKITLGVGSFSDAGRPLEPSVHAPSAELREKVWARDGRACRYCGFAAQKYQEVRFTGASPADKGEDHYVTACSFCHQCFHVDKVDRMQSGAVIWLPEIGQAALNHICRALYIARISRGPMAEAARAASEALLARKEEAEKRLGTHNPRVLAQVMQDFLEGGEYRQRGKKLQGFRILPLDRRIIREGELEFNQFPQVLAYWRSKDGPFGDHPAKDWGARFFALSDRVRAAA